MALDPFWALLVGLLVLALTLALHATHLHGAGRVRLHFHLARKAHHHLALALAAALLAGFLAGALGAASYVVLYGPQGPLQPPLVALRESVQGHRERHVLGLHRRPGRVLGVHRYGATQLPLAVDLSGFAPPVGDQGPVNSCASWAVGYGLASYYAARSGGPLARGGAPMFLYSQATGGTDAGTTFPAVYKLLLRAGIDARALYRQGDHNYHQLPTRAERQRAQQWRRVGSGRALRSWRVLFLGQEQGSSVRGVIEQAMAAGDPVTVGIPVADNIMNAGRRSYFIQGLHGSYWGDHALVAFKYDANGIWTEGSWGTSWGLSGWVELSWSFVAHEALEADALVPQ